MRGRVAVAVLSVLASLLHAAPADAVEPIVVCQHVPITGAAAIPRHPARFGQFYFDHVNDNGGVDGRPVRFLSYDDAYSPVGAQQAFERCQQEGAHLVLGPMGRDQVAAVSRRAGQFGYPYLAGLGALRDLGSSVNLGGPADEDLGPAMADTILDTFEAPRIGFIRIYSPFYDAVHDAFADRLRERGSGIAVDRRVQKDETGFGSLMTEMAAEGVDVIGLAVTPMVMLKMLQQKPSGYDPAFAPVGPDFALDLIAQAAGPRARMIAFNAVSPAFDEDAPYGDEVREFRRIFDAHRPEDDVPVDDIDWHFYLRARQAHRLIDALDGDTSPQAVLGLLDTYTETPAQAYPDCALDLTQASGSDWHVFRSQLGEWKQSATCVGGGVAVDLERPQVACAQLASTVSCRIADTRSGVGAFSLTLDAPLGGPVAEGGAECVREHVIELEALPGPHTLYLSADDCAGNRTDHYDVVVTLP